MTNLQTVEKPKPVKRGMLDNVMEQFNYSAQNFMVKNTP